MRTGKISSVEQQYESAVHDVVLIDRSAIGRIELTGKDGLDLLNRLSTRNLLEGKNGHAIATVFATDKGRIVDYLHVLQKEESLLLLTSPGNEEHFSRWIDKFTIMEDIHCKKLTSRTAMISLIGPNARAFAESVFVFSLEPNRFVETQLAFGPVIILHRNEFETQFIDLVVGANVASELKRMLIKAKVDVDLLEMEDDVYEMFRISRGIPAFGHELTESFNPYEVGLSHAISFNKGCYLGQEVIARLDTYDKVQREIYGILFDATDMPGAGSIVHGNNEAVGILTSVSSKTYRGKRICLSVLKKKLIKADDNVSVISGEDSFQGMVRRIPVLL